MIDHTGVTVSKGDFEKTKEFYLAALGPLGYKEQVSPMENVVGIGPSMMETDFWIAGVRDDVVKKSVHTAFRAKSMILQSVLYSMKLTKTQTVMKSTLFMLLLSRLEELAMVPQVPGPLHGVLVVHCAH